MATPINDNSNQSAGLKDSLSKDSGIARFSECAEGAYVSMPVKILDMDDVHIGRQKVKYFHLNEKSFLILNHDNYITYTSCHPLSNLIIICVMLFYFFLICNILYIYKKWKRNAKKRILDFYSHVSCICRLHVICAFFSNIPSPEKIWEYYFKLNKKFENKNCFFFRQSLRTV